MKLPIASLSLASLSLSSAYQPYRVSYKSLLQNNGSGSAADVLEPLQEVGIVSITGIPNFQTHKESTFSSLLSCSLQSSAAIQHTFDDGTVRRTLASHTIPNGMQRMQHGADAAGGACREFDDATDSFRQTVAQVTQLFSSSLSSVLNQDGPLLKAANMHFDNFEDIVEHGEHLEHFHSYVAPQQQPVSDESTIEWHTDQGLFIIFTPGMIDGTPSDGFYIQTEDGTKEMVEFDSHDELVIMLGDGVNQYVNTHLPNDQQLRATPHALVMPSSSPDAARLWYGRMVLPPVDALHPSSDQGPKTFGQLRDLMIGQDQEAMSVGCSSAAMTSRQLEDSSCAEDTLLCWHRCMPLDFEEPVSDEICTSRGLSMACINPRGQLWDYTHGDYYPGCIDFNNYENATDYPALPTTLGENCSSVVAVSRSGEGDTAEHEHSEHEHGEHEHTEPGHVSADASLATDYDHVVSLGTASFAWSVTDDEIDAAISINDIFGWISVGFSSYLTKPKRKGMYGTPVVVGLPGGNYSAQTGLDLSLPTTVQEYRVHDTEASFRHWSEPTNTEAIVGSVTEDECFTTLKFKAGGIGDQTFNVTGTDALIWAANTEDSFVGYHGRKYRGFFFVNWQEGTIEGWPEEPEEEPEEEDTSGASSVSFLALLAAPVLAFLAL